jgi:hypothetical protein
MQNQSSQAGECQDQQHTVATMLCATKDCVVPGRAVDYEFSHLGDVGMGLVNAWSRYHDFMCLILFIFSVSQSG